MHDRIRGFSPFPGAYFESDLGKGLERIKVLRSKLETAQGEPGTVLDDNLQIACGSGSVRLLQVQRAGKGIVAARDFLNGAALAIGSKVT